MSTREMIIEELGVKPQIDPAEEIAIRTGFLKGYLTECNLGGYVLGISGGQDSLLAGILTQRAVSELREEGYDATFHAMLLPYGIQADRADAEAAIEVIGPDHVHDWNIKPATDALAHTFRKAEGRDISDLGRGNIKARMRMTAQYALAGEFGLLVVGTDHAAEALVGFFTKYGDGGVDVAPLSGLTKGQGKQLLHALGAPEHFSTKKPTADLLDEKPGRPDEEELGLRYKEDIDNYLLGNPIDPAVAAVIKAHHEKTAHKRKLPVTPRDWLLRKGDVVELG